MIRITTPHHIQCTVVYIPSDPRVTRKAILERLLHYNIKGLTHLNREQLIKKAVDYAANQGQWSGQFKAKPSRQRGNNTGSSAKRRDKMFPPTLTTTAHRSKRAKMEVPEPPASESTQEARARQTAHENEWV